MSFPWRDHFPMLTETMNGKPLVYLDSAATSLKPRSVVQRMENYLLKHTSNVHRGIYRLSEENTAAYEQVRQQVMSFINAPDRESVIFTKGTTESINLVASCWGRHFLSPGDEIILSPLEHHANIVPWQMIAQERGAHIVTLPLNHQCNLDLSSLESLLTDRTKLIALTMVSNTLGVITPYEEILRAAKKRGVTVLLDAAQAVGHFPVDVQQLDCDFLVFSAHKMMGPNGVGVLYGKRAILEELPPYQGGGNMIATVSLKAGTTWNQLPEKFEAGTPAIAEVLGFGAALEFIGKVGWQEIRKQDHHLSSYVLERLTADPGVNIFGQSSSRVATFGFEVRGVHPHDLGSVLDQEGVAIRTGHHCTQPLMSVCGVTAMARASFGPYNTTQDADQLFNAITKAKKFFL